MPLTAYQGISFVRNTHGPRVMLVPDAYKEVLQGGTAATQEQPAGAEKSVDRGAAAAAAAGSQGSAPGGGGGQQQIQRQQQQQQQLGGGMAAVGQHEVARAAAASVRGNATAANAVVHAMMKHHKAIEQHGGV